MTMDVRELAKAVARELAARDQVSGRGAPPEPQRNTDSRRDHHPSIANPGNSTQSPPAGVRWVRDQARIADFIDHTLLKAEATASEIDKLCAEARELRFAAVCVNPSWVARCARHLASSGVGVATVVGFPLGATSSAAKAHETEIAVRDGATEIDMVVALGHIKSNDWDHVAEDIAAVVRAARGHLVKVIIESAALTPVEIIKASALSREMGAHYVKTSTGFHAAGGASSEAVALMRMVVGDALGVKASGGVRDCEAALRMIAAGATRIGTSSGVSMAKCLGQGPLPVGNLLTVAHGHGPTCSTCQTGPTGTAY